MRTLQLSKFSKFKCNDLNVNDLQKMILILTKSNIYLFKVNNGNTRKRFEICSKLTIKTPERRQ